jgi:hypothetical protein
MRLHPAQLEGLRIAWRRSRLSRGMWARLLICCMIGVVLVAYIRLGITYRVAGYSNLSRVDAMAMLRESELEMLADVQGAWNGDPNAPRLMDDLDLIGIEWETVGLTQAQVHLFQGLQQPQKVHRLNAEYLADPYRLVNTFNSLESGWPLRCVSCCWLTTPANEPVEYAGCLLRDKGLVSVTGLLGDIQTMHDLAIVPTRVHVLALLANVLLWCMGFMLLRFVFLAARSVYRVRRTRCGNCGFLLLGLGEPAAVRVRCPECGRDVLRLRRRSISKTPPTPNDVMVQPEPRSSSCEEVTE